ncbi:MAG: sulfite reductase subunit beta [Candidatus Methanoperedens nitroreducens]|uniref:Sulfite reductase subunit beta n=1 Tax=Candidatus Methanoperedens nitratireducens TaxID=1392998 RepID=A0A0P7ZK37_9EURY|nr:4Fe-4S binding protein [Candidatus Methanoperedens sp. BLZ2]KAB2946936.1 MAG: 4Fe-4S dicluster domain-containing protein [Candidatus Methanoperedens sp.]KPQ44303.1 MAG: sulfite reductase subunit beta [Candidatus Methanoperedens sp. BLZ1]MBZ0176734.1 4Fe-4S binding protein [Candidatus Methanoperedens nitroreducens]MCX9080456.1 4Fe-4S binding protein [Candidatus Methanoperedens sp.]
MIDKSVKDKSNKVKVDTEVEGKTGDIDFNTLKSGGLIKQTQKDLFTVRLRCPGGRVPLSKLEKILEVAKKYAGDYVHLSVRQSIELPYVDYHDFKKLNEELSVADQKIASCGRRVRVPTACSGCEYNPNGIMDTQKMAEVVNEKFFAHPMPHKFKISFSGCPIDCARTSENDLGFQGAVEPKWVDELCIGCRICASACREGAIESDPESGKPVFYAQKCLYCGDCIRSCPTDSWQEERKGWIIRIGGKHGRHPVVGCKIAEFVSDEDIPEFIEAIIKWYEKAGKTCGTLRIGDILRMPEQWDNFICELRIKFDKKLLPAPKMPYKNEIHFE